jgi:Domain of unknown function (DUF4845)
MNSTGISLQEKPRVQRTRASRSGLQRESRQPLELRGQHGGGRLRALLFTAALAAFVFFCYKVIPPYFANYQLEDWLKAQIPFFMVNHTTDEALYNSILKEMHNDGIEVTRDNIKIVQNNANGINVQIDYSVKVDLLVYQWNLHFTPQMNSQSLVQ